MSTEHSSRRTRPAAVWGVLAAVLVWVQVAFVGEYRRVAEVYDQDRVTYRQSWLWRPGLRPVRELEAFLDAAREVVPAGSTVVFSSLSTSGRQDFSRSRWAAYLVPELDLMPAGRTPEAALAEAEYWIAYRTTEELPGWTAVLRHRDGVVYRIER